MQHRKGSSSVDAGGAPEAVRRRVLFVLLITIFMSLVDVSIVNVALPSIQHSLDASDSDVQWVLSGYALTFGIILVAAGRAGDLVGRGGIFIIGLVLFTASSAASGFAPNAEWLNIARFIQGLGSGLLNPQGIGMIQQYFRGSERGRAFGYFGSMVGVSVATGPVLGGLLIKLGGTDFGWRLTFLVNVPIGIGVVILALLWFPKPLFSRKPRAGKDGSGKKQHPMDPIGSLLLGLAVFTILFPFVESGTSALTWLLFPLGIALIAVWVWWEGRYARQGHSPMVDLKIFSIRSFSNGTLIVTLYFLGMTSIWVLVALYLQEGLGKSALQAGLVGIPSALVSALSANWAGKRVMKYGRKVVIGGLFFAIAGLGLSILVFFFQATGYISVWWLPLSLAFIGVAQGFVISPNQTLTLTEVPLQYAGSSGAIMQTGQRIGTSIGIAVITAAVFASLKATSWPIAVTIGFGLIGFVTFCALGAAFKDLHDREG